MITEGSHFKVCGRTTVAKGHEYLPNNKINGEVDVCWVPGDEGSWGRLPNASAVFCCLFCWRDPLKSGLSSYSVFRQLPLQWGPTPPSGWLDILSLFMYFLIRRLYQVLHKLFLSAWPWQGHSCNIIHQRGTQKSGTKIRKRRRYRKPRYGFDTRKYRVTLRTGKREQKFSK